MLWSVAALKETINRETGIRYSSDISVTKLHPPEHMQSHCTSLAMLYDTVHISKSFPVAQIVEHGASNAKIMGSIPRESKSWQKCKNCKLNAM